MNTVYTCPVCQGTARKDGHTPIGSQRARCQLCGKRYTPVKKDRCAPELRARAVQLAGEGMGFRAIGRILGVHHSSVSRWVGKATDDVE